MSKNVSRSAARMRAFQVLYSLQFSPVSTLAELKDVSVRLPDDDEPTGMPAPAPDFAWDLIEGVWSNESALDHAIAGFSRNWRVDRLGKVERTVLRLAIYEMEHHPDVPSRVVISEALNLAARFANEQARHFINGILDAAAHSRETDAARCHA